MGWIGVAVASCLAAPPFVAQRFAGLLVAEGAVELRDMHAIGVDAARGVLALKVTGTAVAYSETDSSSLSAITVEPERCGYKGMAEPFDGVTLALLGPRSDSWVIYRPAHDAGACTPPAESKRRLAQAKQAFAKAGMTVGEKTPYSAVPAGGKLTLDVGGRAVQMTVAEDDAACDRKRRCRGSERIKSVTLLLEGKPIYEIWQVYEGAYAGTASLELMGAFANGTKAFFVASFSSGSGMKGASESATFVDVSPVIDFSR